MFFMWLFYLVVIVGGAYAMWHFVIQPVMAEKENAARKRQEDIDNRAAEMIAKEALLAGDDIEQDLGARVALLQELSAKMKKLSQTRIVAERIADVEACITRLNDDIAAADAKAEKARAVDAPDGDEGAGPQEKPVSNPDTPVAKPEGGPVKVAHAKKD